MFALGSQPLNDSIAAAGTQQVARKQMDQRCREQRLTRGSAGRLFEFQAAATHHQGMQFAELAMGEKRIFRQT